MVIPVDHPGLVLTGTYAKVSISVISLVAFRFSLYFFLVCACFEGVSVL